MDGCGVMVRVEEMGAVAEGSDVVGTPSTSGDNCLDADINILHDDKCKILTR